MSKPVSRGSVRAVRIFKWPKEKRGTDQTRTRPRVIIAMDLALCTKAAPHAIL